MGKHNLDIFTEIMEDAGIKASKEQITEVFELFTGHMSMLADTRFDSHYPSKTSTPTCNKCERLEGELKRIQPVSQCCGMEVYYNRDHWVCQSCNRSTIRVPKK